MGKSHLIVINLFTHVLLPVGLFLGSLTAHTPQLRQRGFAATATLDMARFSIML